MSTYAEIIARAETLAQGKASDPSLSAVIDGTMTAEAIFPHALRFCTSKLIKAGDQSLNVARDHAIELYDGVGTLPDEVLREFLADSSYITRDKYATFVRYPDFKRRRLDNIATYYTSATSKDGVAQFLYSRSRAALNRTANNITVAYQDNVITDEDGTNWTLTNDDVGRRFRVMSDQTLVIDAILAFISDSLEGTLHGAAVGDAAGNGYVEIYETLDDVFVRSFGSVTTTSNSDVFSASGASLTADDIGRRIKITHPSGSVAVDAFISEVTSGTSGKMTALAVMSIAGTGSATLSYLPCVLNCPSAPALPASIGSDVDWSPKLVEDVIVTIAAAMIGEIPLAALMG